MFKFKKETKANPFWLNHQSLSNHIMIMGTTGSGMSSTLANFMNEYMFQNYQIFINVLYQAKHEFKINDKMQGIKWYIKENRYDFIFDNLTYHFYLEQDCEKFIESYKNYLCYFRQTEDKNILYFNLSLIDDTLKSFKKYLLELSSYKNTTSHLQYLELKETEEQKNHFDELLTYPHQEEGKKIKI